MQNLRAVIDIYRKITYILTKKQKQGAIASFAAMILCSLLELLSVSVIYPFLQLILDEVSFNSKWYVRVLYSGFPSIGMNGIIVFFCVVIIAVFLIKNIMAIICLYIQMRYVERLRRELAVEVFRSYMKRPYEYFINTNTGMIMRGVQSGPSVVNSIIIAAFQFITELMTTMMIGLYLIYVDIRIAFATILLAGLCFLMIVIGFKRKIKVMGKQQWEYNAKSFNICSQAFSGIKEVIVMDRRDCFTRRYEDMSKEVEHINVIYSCLSACPDRVLEGICMSGFLAIVCVRIITGVELTTFISTLGVFVMGAFKILPSISKMSSRVTTVIFQMSGLNDCYDNIRNVREYEDVSDTITDKANYEYNELAISTLEESICAKDVTWQYANSPKTVLNGLNIVIHKGESVAFIGESGAGKSTLADLILGLYMPKKGQVLVDGIDVYSIPHEWSRMIGYVPQSVFLLDDTVRANIAFGLPEEETSDDRIWGALRQAKLDLFVKELPLGLDTIVGERGVKFSGGQRQRVAIARALYENPPILILDEATSALDSETENGVMEAIDSLHGSKTLIIIAHRLSTIRNCDRIYEIVNGQAVERDKTEVLANI